MKKFVLAIWLLFLVGCSTHTPVVKMDNYDDIEYIKGYNHSEGRPINGYGYSYDKKAPCVTGYCGPVHVDGYFRKDGTYVRPHTRSLPHTGGGRRR